ncbi:MAG: helix-turn-helix transcriptional regulator [Maricaulaceae bacterium]
MTIGVNTRQIILEKLAISQTLSEIEYCQELWLQTHGYNSISFIGLTAQLAFDRNAYFIHSNKNDVRNVIENRLTPEFLLPLRRALITEDMSFITKAFSDLNFTLFPTYGPQQTTGLFLLTSVKNSNLSIEDRHNISQDIHMFSRPLFSQYLTGTHAPIKLTTRESEVLSWVAQGKSNIVIAEILGVSHHTIDNYLRRAYAKIGVNNRTLAAVKAISLGLTVL